MSVIACSPARSDRIYWMEMIQSAIAMLEYGRPDAQVLRLK